jgi:hypothetical protein
MTCIILRCLALTGLLGMLLIPSTGPVAARTPWTVAASEPQVVWTRQFGSTARDDASGIAVDHSGAVYVTGSTRGALPDRTSSGFWDAFLVKLGPDGTSRWSRQFGTRGRDHASAVAVDGSGAVYVVGSTQVGTRDGHAFLRKYSAGGSLRWTRAFGGGGSDGAGVAVDARGSIYVVGDSHRVLPSSGGHGETADSWVRKYGSDGSLRWDRRFGTTTRASAQAVAVAASGAVHVAGYEWDTLPGQWRTGWDAFVRTYESDGSLRWSRRFGSGDDDMANAIAVAASGAIHIAGDTWSSLPHQTNAGWLDAFLQTLGPAGTRRWAHQFGTPRDDSATAVSVDGLGNTVVAGAIDQAGAPDDGEPDAFARAFGPDGAEQWTLRFGTTRDDRASGVAIAAMDVMYVAGSTKGTFPGESRSGRSDIFVRRYAPATG